MVTTGQTAPPAVAGFTITRVNPLEHAESIKQLFLDHERPEFPDYFDRAFPNAVAEGATSWVGWDEGGRMCAHIAQFPRAFAHGDRTVRGALLANLMVATAYRTFWPALAFARQVVNDVKASGWADLIYADPNERAQPVLRAAGFHSFGALQRFVLPLTDRRLSVALAIRGYHLIGRLRTAPLVAIERSAAEVAVFHLPPAGVRALRPIRAPSLYRGRLAGYPGAADHWYTFHSPRSQHLFAGTALVRGLDRDGAIALCAVQVEPPAGLSSALVTLAGQLRHTGATRLEIWTLAGSQTARAVRRAGFVPRPERWPVLTQPLTELGAEAVAAECDWQLFPVDLDR